MKTFSNPIKQSGSNLITINVSHDGKPFGIIRTFTDTETDQSPWQVISLRGEYKNFWGTGSASSKKQALELAKEYVMSI